MDTNFISGNRRRRTGKGGKTKHQTCLQITIYHSLQGLSGKGWTGLCVDWIRLGRTLSTYQGSCDRIHSVFLVLFWVGMDLKKQKDGATDMHA